MNKTDFCSEGYIVHFGRRLYIQIERTGQTSGTIYVEGKWREMDGSTPNMNLPENFGFLFVDQGDNIIIGTGNDWSFPADPARMHPDNVFDQLREFYNSQPALRELREWVNDDLVLKLTPVLDQWKHYRKLMGWDACRMYTKTVDDT